MPARCLAVGLIILFAVPASLRAQVGPTKYIRHRGVVQVANETAIEQFHIGIIGDVKRSGVYTFSDRFPNITRLVEAAGGLSESASRSLCVVRDGWTGQRVFYSNRSEFPLVPGDVVIVDSNEARDSQAGQATPAPKSIGNNEDKARKSFASTDVILLNVIERPVHMRLYGNQATLAGALAALNQESNIGSRLQVIGSSAASTLRGDQMSPVDRLPSDCVLVFPAGIVAQGLLPKFEPALPEHVTAGAVSAPATTIEVVDNAATAQPNDLSLPLTVHRETNTELGSTEDASANQVLPEKDANSLSQGPAPIIISEPAEQNSVAESAAAPLPAIGAFSTRQPEPRIESPFLPVSDGQPRLRLSQNIDPAHLPQLPADSLVQMPEASERSEHLIAKNSGDSTSSVEPVSNKDLAADSSSNSLNAITPLIVVCIIGGIGVLSAFAMLWSMARDDSMKQSQTTTQTIQTNWLDAMIKGQLAVREEPLEFELNRQFFNARKYRVDAAHTEHTLVRPHFRTPAPVAPAASGKENAAGAPHFRKTRTGQRDTTVASRGPSTGTTDALENHSAALDRALTEIRRGSQE